MNARTPHTLSLVLICGSAPTCCGHPMVWEVFAGGWVCGYCPGRA